MVVQVQGWSVLEHGGCEEEIRVRGRAASLGKSTWEGGDFKGISRMCERTMMGSRDCTPLVNKRGLTMFKFSTEILWSHVWHAAYINIHNARVEISEAGTSVLFYTRRRSMGLYHIRVLLSTRRCPNLRMSYFLHPSSALHRHLCKFFSFPKVAGSLKNKYKILSKLLACLCDRTICFEGKFILHENRSNLLIVR